LRGGTGGDLPYACELCCSYARAKQPRRGRPLYVIVEARWNANHAPCTKAASYRCRSDTHQSSRFRGAAPHRYHVGAKMTKRDTKMATNMAIKNTETPGKRPTRPHGQ